MQGWAGPSWSPHGAVRARIVSHRGGRPRPQRGHRGRQVRLPGDKPQQLPRPGPPPSPFLHVRDSDRVCRSHSWFLQGSLGIPCPQHPRHSATAPPAPCPTSQPTPLPASPARESSRHRAQAHSLLRPHHGRDGVAVPGGSPGFSAWPMCPQQACSQPVCSPVLADYLKAAASHPA